MEQKLQKMGSHMMEVPVGLEVPNPWQYVTVFELAPMGFFTILMILNVIIYTVNVYYPCQADFWGTMNRFSLTNSKTVQWRTVTLKM